MGMGMSPRFRSKAQRKADKARKLHRAEQRQQMRETQTAMFDVVEGRPNVVRMETWGESGVSSRSAHETRGTTGGGTARPSE